VSAPRGARLPPRALLALAFAACSGPSGSPGVDGGSRDAPGPGDAGPVCPPEASTGGLLLRYNQVGYRTTDAKRLYVMSRESLPSGSTFVVKDGACHVVQASKVGDDQGSWSPAYPHVALLDASSITSAGSYTVTATLGTNRVSAVFRVGSGSSLYGSLLPNALFFYEAQRDGPDVVSSVLGRKPSHLADEAASVYSTPDYKNDVLQEDLVKIGGPVDLSGGWFDAGDYLKFVETASYVDAVMLLAVRDHASTLGTAGIADFEGEARFGLEWLSKMYEDKTGTLYYQVGIGDGNDRVLADHDEWRLPQVDDTLDVHPGDAEYYVRYRPAFVSGVPGSTISPNLAGRLAADFALGYVVYRTSDASFASACLLAAEHVYALADTGLEGHPFTTAPYDYYPETAWRDDLELGATELHEALAAASSAGASLPPGLPETDPGFYLGEAAKWAHAYLTGDDDGADSLNLYDVSALAHYELVKAMKKAGSPTDLAVTGSDLLNDLDSQIQAGSEQAKSDPFELGVAYATVDAVPHALGLALSADFYEELTGDTKWTGFGLAQRDYVLGANAWGSSFLVGDGQTFPDCLQHQVANLVGTLDGKPPILLGAAVDGPSDPANLDGLSLQSGMRKCPPGGGDAFKPFDGHGAVYQDNVIDWPTVEPADDYTVLSVLLFARE
jgi:endoglucanase